MKDYGKVIYILIGVVALLLSYLLGFNKLTEKNNELQTSIDELQNKYDTLKADYANKDTYIKETKSFDKQYEDILSKFDTSLLNEGQIMDVYNMQTDCGVQVLSLSLSQPTETYAFDGSLTTPEMAAQQNAVNPDGTPAETESIITTTAIDSSYRGVSNTMSLIARGNYAGIKSMLSAITDGKKRKVPSSISITYDMTTEEIICDIAISEYAITGKDRNPEKVKINESAIGRDNIFFNQLGAVSQSS